MSAVKTALHELKLFFGEQNVHNLIVNGDSISPYNPYPIPMLGNQIIQNGFERIYHHDNLITYVIYTLDHESGRVKAILEMIVKNQNQYVAGILYHNYEAGFIAYSPKSDNWNDVLHHAFSMFDIYLSEDYTSNTSNPPGLLDDYILKGPDCLTT